MNIVRRVRMEQNSTNMLVCLASFGKKPMDILLELIQFELYTLNIDESDFIKKLSRKLQNIYDITIPDILLTKWIDCKFTKKDKKLVLNTCKEDIRSYIATIKNKEEDFNKKMAEIRKSFQQYANETYKLHFNNEEIKEVFNDYFYIDLCYQNNTSLNKTNRSEISFVFNQYMRHLWNEKSDYLDIIENFGVVNQIRKIVINEDNIDKKFLEDCNIYIDTPIMMKALGYDGKALGDSYTELIDKLKEAGAKVCFFEHSFDELWGILFSFKKNIAQNFLDAKGVNQFLRARKEYKNDEKVSKELSLDENVIRNEIKNLECDILAHIDEKELDTDDDFQNWVFDENKLTDIIRNRYHEQNMYQNRIEKDVTSIAAIARLREKEKIKFPNSYKHGKFFLLTDNYTLIQSIKSYYQDNEDNNLNELIFENTILFELWQNLFDNNTFNKALFRSKCFAFTEIDDKFKEKLYKICRKMDRYEPEKNMSDQFIEHPELEEEIYSQTLSKKNYNDEYLKRIINNTVKQKEEKTANQLNAAKAETKKVAENAKVKEEEYKLNIERERERAANDIQKLINKKIEKHRKWWQFLLWIERLFTKNKTIDEIVYYEAKAKKSLGIE